MFPLVKLHFNMEKIEPTMENEVNYFSYDDYGRLGPFMGPNISNIVCSREDFIHHYFLELNHLMTIELANRRGVNLAQMNCEYQIPKFPFAPPPTHEFKSLETRDFISLLDKPIISTTLSPKLDPLECILPTPHGSLQKRGPKKHTPPNAILTNGVKDPLELSLELKL